MSTRVVSVKGMGTLNALNAIQVAQGQAQIAKLHKITQQNDIQIAQNNELIGKLSDVGEQIKISNKLLKESLDIQKKTLHITELHNKVVDATFELRKISKRLNQDGVSDFEKKLCAEFLLLEIKKYDIKTSNIHNLEDKEVLHELIQELEAFKGIKLDKENQKLTEKFIRYEQVKILNNFLNQNKQIFPSSLDEFHLFIEENEKNETTAAKELKDIKANPKSSKLPKLLPLWMRVLMFPLIFFFVIFSLVFLEGTGIIAGGVEARDEWSEWGGLLVMYTWFFYGWHLYRKSKEIDKCKDNDAREHQNEIRKQKKQIKDIKQILSDIAKNKEAFNKVSQTIKKLFNEENLAKFHKCLVTDSSVITVDIANLVKKEYQNERKFFKNFSVVDSLLISGK